MIRLAWCVLCRAAYIDKNTNSVSLSVADQAQVRVAAPPPEDGIHHIRTEMELVSLWYDDTGPVSDEFDARLQISLGGRLLHSAPLRIEFKGIQLLRARLQLTTVPYAGPGTYIYALERQRDGEWVELAALPFIVAGDE